MMNGRNSTRREMLTIVGGAALAGLSPFQEMTATAAGMWRENRHVRELLGDAIPATDGITLELPEVSVNGEAVPLRLHVQAPEEDDDFVQVAQVIAPANPFSRVATFHFTPSSGRAEVTTHIRLDDSQTVIAVARLRSGRVRVAERAIRVTSTGCYVSAEADWSDAMSTRVRVPVFESGIASEVVCLIKHPMENGLGGDIPEGTLRKRIIERFEASIDGMPVLSARFGRSVAANPYLRFYAAPRRSGLLTLEWTEDTGRRAMERARIRLR